MDSAQLTQLLQPTEGDMTLVGTAFGSPHITELFENYFSEGALSLKNAVVHAENGSLIVEGEAASSVFELDDLAVTARFFLVDDMPEVLISFGNVPADWQVSRSFSALAGSFLDHFVFRSARLELDSLGQNNLRPDFQDGFADPIDTSEVTIKRGLTLRGDACGQSENPLIQKLFPADQWKAINAPIELVQDLPRLWMSIDPVYSVEFQGVQLLLCYEYVSLLELDEAGELSRKGLSRFVTNLGFPMGEGTLEIPLVASVPDGAAFNEITLESDLQQASALGMSALASLIPGDIASTIPAGFPALDALLLESLQISLQGPGFKPSSVGAVVALDQQWHIVPDEIAFGDLRLDLQLSNLLTTDRALSAVVTGVIDFFGAPLTGTADLSARAFSCTLAEGSAVDLDAILASKFGLDIPNLDVTTFNLSGDLGGGSYSIDLASATGWAFDPAGRYPAIENLSAHLDYTRGIAGAASTVEGTVGGTIELFGSSNTINANFASGSPLNFSVSSQDVSLTTILETFLGEGNLPDEVPDVIFPSVELNITPKTGQFSLNVSAKINWQAPFAEGHPLDATLSLALERKASTTSGAQTIRGPLTCTLTLNANGSLSPIQDLELKQFSFLFKYAEAAKTWSLSGTTKVKLFSANAALSLSLLSTPTTRTIQMRVTKPGKLISLGSSGEISFQNLSIGITRARPGAALSTTPTQVSLTPGTTWEVKAIGGITFPDNRFDGQVTLFKGETQAGFIFSPANVNSAKASVKLPPDYSIKAELKFKDIRIIRQEETSPPTWLFSISGSAGFTGLPNTGIMKKIRAVFQNPMSAELIITSNSLSLTIPRIINQQVLSIGGTPDLGDAAIDVSEFKLDIGSSQTNFSMQLAFGLPSKLNEVIKADFFNTFDANAPLVRMNQQMVNPTMTRFKVSLNAFNGAIELQMLNSPLKGIQMDAQNNVTLDKSFGTLIFTLPPIAFSKGAFSTTFSVTQQNLRLPLTPLKALLELCKLNAVSDLIPDGIALKNPDVFNADGTLDVDKIISFLGVEPTPAIKTVLGKISAMTDQLPDRLIEFLRDQLPPTFTAKVTVSGSGNISIDFKVPDNPSLDDPASERLRLLGFGGIALTGIALKRFSFRSFMGGQLLLMKVDATVDFFSLPSMIISAKLPEATKELLTASSKLESSIDLRKLVMLVVYQAGIPIPIPLFYDNLGFRHLGLSGLELAANLSFEPHIDVTRLPDLFNMFGAFFTDSEARLPTEFSDPDSISKIVELPFTVGPTYIQLPKYLGGRRLGPENGLAPFRPIEMTARALNTMKFMSMSDLIGLIPQDSRFGAVDINFAFLQADAAWAITNRTELMKLSSTASPALTAYSSLSSEDRTAFLQLAQIGKADVDERQSLLVFLRGRFNLPRILDLEARFGIAIAADKGFGSGFALKGSIANFFEFGASGLIIVDRSNYDNANAFRIEADASLGIRGHEVLRGSLLIDDDEFQMTSALTLLPAESPLQINADATLIVHKSNGVSFMGRGDITLEGIYIVTADVRFKNGALRLAASLLGAAFELDYEPSIPKFQGIATISSTTTLAIPQVKLLNIALDVNLNLSLSFNVTVTLLIIRDRIQAALSGHIQWDNASLPFNPPAFDITTSAIANDAKKISNMVVEYARTQVDKLVDEARRSLLNFVSMMKNALSISDFRMTNSGFSLVFLGSELSLQKEQRNNTLLYTGSARSAIRLFNGAFTLSDTAGTKGPSFSFGALSAQPYLHIDGKFSMALFGISTNAFVQYASSALLIDIRSVLSVTGAFTLGTFTQFRYSAGVMRGGFGLSFNTDVKLGYLPVKTPVRVGVNLGIVASASEFQLTVTFVCEAMGESLPFPAFSLAINPHTFNLDSLKSEFDKQVLNKLKSELEDLFRPPPIPAELVNAWNTTVNALQSFGEDVENTFKNLLGIKEKPPAPAAPPDPNMVMRDIAQRLRLDGHSEARVAISILQKLNISTWMAAVHVLNTIGCNQEVAQDVLQSLYSVYAVSQFTSNPFPTPVRRYQKRLTDTLSMYAYDLEPYKSGWDVASDVGPMFYALSIYIPGCAPVYQYVGREANEKTTLFSTNLYEAPQWRLEKVAFYAFKEPGNHLVPVFQYRKKGLASLPIHAYSIEPMLRGWELDKIAFYVQPSRTTIENPVHPQTPAFPTPIREYWIARSDGGKNYVYLTSSDTFLPASYNRSETPIPFYGVSKRVKGSVPVYLYGVSTTNAYRYQYSTNPNVGEGWQLRGMAFYAYAVPAPNTQPIYQYYAHTNEGIHFRYGINPNPPSGWALDKVVFYAPAETWTQPAPTSVPSVLPVYGFHSPRSDTGWNFAYSMAPNLGGTWVNDGVSFNTLSEPVQGLAPVYQLHAPGADGQTRLMYSRNAMVGDPWKSDGTVFQGFQSEQGSHSQPVYQYDAEGADGTRYMYSSRPDIAEGWTRRHIICYAPTDGWQANLPAPVYEYHNERSDGGWGFRYDLNAGHGSPWVRDRVGFYALPRSFSGTVLITVHKASGLNGTDRYRFHPSQTTINGWTRQGESFYAFSSPGENTVPVYEYSVQASDGDRYMYSTSPKLAAGWTLRRIIFHAPAENWVPNPGGIAPYPTNTYAEIWRYYIQRPDGGAAFTYSRNTNLQGWAREISEFGAYSRPVEGTVPIYRYTAAGQVRRHLFSSNPYVGQGWTLEDIEFFAFPTPRPNTIPVYRYFHIAEGGDGIRFALTTNRLYGQGWTLEHPAFHVPTGSGAQRPYVPLYRYYTRRDDAGASFFYATQPAMPDNWNADVTAFNVPIVNSGGMEAVKQFHRVGLNGVILFQYGFVSINSESGWIEDGIVFYAHRSPAINRMPVYRYYATGSDGNRYFYSSNRHEQGGWTYHGIAFYV